VDLKNDPGRSVILARREKDVANSGGKHPVRLSGVHQKKNFRHLPAGPFHRSSCRYAINSGLAELSPAQVPLTLLGKEKGSLNNNILNIQYICILAAV
jgi:hypothetical protein